MEVATGRKTEILAHPKRDIHAAIYSPDRSWIALHFAPTDGPGSLFLAPAAPDGKAAPDSEWIPVMDRPGIHPACSGLRTGTSSISSPPLKARRASGPSVWIALPGALWGTPSSSIGPPASGLQSGPWFGPAVGPKQIIFPVIERTGNIWLAE